MEKYSRWSDLTTGINPFVPHKQRWHENIAVRVLQGITGTALVIIRIPLLMLLGILLMGINVIVSILGILPFIGRLLKRLTEWLLCGTLLLILGVFVTTEAANTRRLGLVSKGKETRRVGPKDLIVCNHTSFIEILWLARRFSPLYVFVTEHEAAKGMVHACGLIEALYRACALPIAQQKGVPSKLEDIIRHASQPIAIFPEGARSNGKSILRFLPILETLEEIPKRMHLVVFRYEYKYFSPSWTAGRAWKQIVWMCFHLYHSMVVTHLNASDWNVADIEIPTKSTVSTRVRNTSSKAKISTSMTNTHVERIRTLMASMLRTKSCELTSNDFLSFTAYWEHVNQGGKQPASAFTDRKAPHEHAQWTR